MYDQRAGDVRLFVFNLSHGLVRVCEIDSSHMGKNNGNSDLVIEKNVTFVNAYLICIIITDIKV